MIDIRIEHRFPSKKGGFHLDVAFSADDDQVVFFGPSGSGKTLTMQAVAGLFTPERGRIVIGGRTVFDSDKNICLPARERRLGYLFQDYALFPHLSVRQNIAFGLGGGGLFALPGKKERAQVDAMLDTFEISHIADLKPARISGGQQQRAALARALANRPDILLLDEPFSALDPLMRERMRKQCKELLSRFNTPTIIISHDPADVAVFAQGIVLYENGQAHTRMSADSLESCAADPDSLLGSLADAVRGLRRADGAREQ